MSILDKPLSPGPQRTKRRSAILILSIVAALLIVFFVLTDIRADFAIGVHFLTAPNHFTYQGHSDYVSAVACFHRQSNYYLQKPSISERQPSTMECSGVVTRWEAYCYWRNWKH